MTRLVLALLVVVQCLTGTTSAAAPAPARLLVGAKEFRLTLSRAAIKSGPAIVELANYGEDAHDLRLRRVGGRRIYKIATVEPGDVGELDANLLPGRFRLWCSIADHAALGMQTTLIVRR